MFIQLTSRQHLDLDGLQKTYQPGDWINVGKQLALTLIDTGQARLAPAAKIDLGDVDCGAWVPIGASGALAQLRRIGLELPVDTHRNRPTVRPQLLHDRVLVWDGAPLRIDLIPVGFGFLDRWEVVCPIWSYDELACDLGTEADRAETERAILDLRVPVYDTRAMFLRRTPATERLMDIWEGEHSDDRVGGPDGDTRLAFLRALWQVQPLILAVPPTWMKDRGDTVDVTSQVGR